MAAHMFEKEFVMCLGHSTSLCREKLSDGAP
jgi:hypothetical protein